MISEQEMQRQLHAYALEEMRNRGLEDAALRLEEWAVRYGSKKRYEIGVDTAVAEIRACKRDPRKKMTDWWGSEVADASKEVDRKAESSGPAEAPDSQEMEGLR